ncbi:MAG: efflux RND transporter periplasmic adaptor subunit [Pseudobdellovibrionaceae bacterium]
MKSQTSSITLQRIVYGIIALGVLVSSWFLFRKKPIVVDSAVVTKGVFNETFLIDGKLRAKNKTTVVAFTNGDIDEIDLRAGDEIKKGQIITVLHWDYTKKITSPITGVIAKIYRETAGPVNRGEPLVDIIDPHNLEIVAEPLTSDALRISKDTPVQVIDLGNSSANYSAKVTEVSKVGFVKISALGVEEERTEVRMEFVNIPQELSQRLGDNFHVELSMLVSRDENVLKIPLGALFKDNENWAVYIISDGKAQLRHVEIAKRNDREASVTRGLHQDDRVILFPGDVIIEGSKVKIK